MGFLSLKVGSKEHQVPIVRMDEEHSTGAPSAVFEAHGNAFAIMLTGDVPTAGDVPETVKEAARQALVHLSKLHLN